MSKAMVRMLKQRLTAIELFAGAGLLSRAFQIEGFDIVQAIELDQQAAASYALNHGEHVQCCDTRHARPIGSVDLVIAGPPCQGFSTLNRKRHGDPRNDLSFEVVKWAKLVGPQCVVIENVATFLHSPQWQKVARSFRGMGYGVQSMVANAHDYGVPQLRNRSFTIASRGEFPKIKPIRGGYKTVRDAWADLPTKCDASGMHVAPEPSELAASRMRLIPPEGSRREMMEIAPELAPPSWSKLGSAVTDTWGRMRWDEPSNTLRTCLQNPSKGRYIHPTEDRVITLREAARLQTIEDNYKFSGSRTAIAKQIGNSVPLRLGRAVARAARRSFAA